jgi:4'-phosphopantetheinyl transferase
MDEVLLNAAFQPESAGAVSLGSRQIHVWGVPLGGEAEAFLPLLSKGERDRAERFRFVDHRRRYAIAHGALRAVLGGYCGHDPCELTFATGPRGKPYLTSTGAGASGVFFNLSHSSQLALIAVGDCELGIDLEKCRHLESMLEIARRHFSAAEYAALEGLQDAALQQGFYRCWTRKEAYIKAVGEGLSLPLDTFEVSLGEQPEFLAFRDGRYQPAEWSLFDVSPADGFVAALAAHGAGFRLQTYQLHGY